MEVFALQKHRGSQRNEGGGRTQEGGRARDGDKVSGGEEEKKKGRGVSGPTPKQRTKFKVSFYLWCRKEEKAAEKVKVLPCDERQSEPEKMVHFQFGRLS